MADPCKVRYLSGLQHIFSVNIRLLFHSRHRGIPKTVPEYICPGQMGVFLSSEDWAKPVS